MVLSWPGATVSFTVDAALYCMRIRKHDTSEILGKYSRLLSRNSLDGLLEPGFLEYSELKVKT